MGGFAEETGAELSPTWRVHGEKHGANEPQVQGAGNKGSAISASCSYVLDGSCMHHSGNSLAVAGSWRMRIPRKEPGARMSRMAIIALAILGATIMVAGIGGLLAAHINHAPAPLLWSGMAIGGAALLAGMAARPVPKPGMHDQFVAQLSEEARLLRAKAKELDESARSHPLAPRAPWWRRDAEIARRQARGIQEEIKAICLAKESVQVCRDEVSDVEYDNGG